MSNVAQIHTVLVCGFVYDVHVEACKLQVRNTKEKKLLAPESLTLQCEMLTVAWQIANRSQTWFGVESRGRATGLGVLEAWSMEDRDEVTMLTVK